VTPYCLSIETHGEAKHTPNIDTKVYCHKYIEKKIKITIITEK